jgi:hypothetical protein
MVSNPLGLAQNPPGGHSSSLILVYTGGQWFHIPGSAGWADGLRRPVEISYPGVGRDVFANTQFFYLLGYLPA